MATRTQSPLQMFLSSTPLPVKVQTHLRSVYTTLTLAVAVATVGALLQATVPIPGLGLLAGISTIPLLLWFLYQPQHSKNRPLAFYTFAFADGLAVGPLVGMASTADPMLPLLAFAGCVVVFAGFSVSALFAKRGKYLALGSVLWTMLGGMLFVRVLNLFTSRFYGMGFLLYGGLLMMCGFVLYDTQVIVEKAVAGDSDYLRHAMDLLIDFVNMFRRILIIMMKKDQDRKERERNRRDD